MILPGEPLEFAAQDLDLVGVSFDDVYFEVFRPVVDGGDALDDVINRIKYELDVNKYDGPLRTRYGEETRSAVLATQHEVRTIATAQQLWNELGNKGLKGALNDLIEEVPALLSTRYMTVAEAQEDPVVSVEAGEETVTGYRLFGIPLNEQAARLRNEQAQVLEVLGVPVSRRQQQRLYTRVPVGQVSRRTTEHDRDRALDSISNSGAQLALGPARYRLTAFENIDR